MRPEDGPHWLSSPKNRALYHLLQVTGTALEESLPRRAQQIADAKESLTTLRADQQGTTLSILIDTAPHEVFVPRGAIRFYRRGDIDTMVARRPDDLDDRARNWDTAVSLWGDWLGFDAHERDQAAQAARRLAPPPTPALASESTPALMGVLVVLALAAIAAWWASSAVALCAVAAAALTTALVDDATIQRRTAVALGAGAIAAVVALVSAPPLGGSQSTAVAAFGLTAASLGVRFGRIRWYEGAALALIAGLLLGGLGWWWVLAGLGVLLGDALTTAVGANRLAYNAHLARLVGFAIGVIVSRFTWALSGSGGAATWGIGAAVLVVVLLLAAVAFAVVDFVNGIRASLTTVIVPTIGLIAAIVSGTERLALASAFIGALVASAISLARPRLVALASPNVDPAPVVEPPSQPVTIRSRDEK